MTEKHTSHILRLGAGWWENEPTWDVNCSCGEYHVADRFDLACDWASEHASR